MTNDPVMTAPLMVWAYCSHAQGFNTSAQKLASCSEPSAAFWYPTGFCIQASVATMKKPEAHDPTNTMKAANQCIVLLNRFSPERERPRNLDSRKNEKRIPMASV